MSLLKSILAFFFVSRETKKLMKEIEVTSEKEKFLNDLRLSEERQKKKQSESPKTRPSPSYSVSRSHGGRKIEQKNDDRGRGYRDDYTPASFLFGGDVGSNDGGSCGGGDGGGSCGGGGGGE
ncbi:hypothetical protein [Aeromonas media]|uniref:hypothetical protein n=1 Tax=Aeromonas media TaxID=651 RepID=UPI003D1A52A9